MIIGNFTSYTKSEFYEIVNVINKCLGQPLSVKCDFWNGLNNERYRQFKSNHHKRNNSFVQISFLVYSFVLSWLILCRFLHIHFIYHQNTVTKKETFSWTAFNAFNASTPSCRILSNNGKDSIGVFQVITCWLGVTYNVNVRHTKSSMLNTVVSHAVYKSFFDYVHSGIHCSCRWYYFVYTLGSFLNNLLFSVLPALWPWTNHWGNGSCMSLYCNCTCKSSSILINSNIFASFALPSKTKWKYNVQLSNSLNWKPARCWNADNSSGKDCFLGRLRIVWCVGNEDVYLKVFEDKQLVQDSSTTVVYIFHIAGKISLQNIIHTVLSVSLLANLFYWQNESTVYLTQHFLEENEILYLVSFHYWHNQKYTSEPQIY